MVGDRFSSSTSCSGWLHETAPARPDPSLSCLFLKVATHPLEGFIDGLFGDEDAIDLPERATEALHHLGEITAMIRGVLALMERESAPPASDQDVVRMLGEVRELSRIAEKELAAPFAGGERNRPSGHSYDGRRPAQEMTLLSMATENW